MKHAILRDVSTERNYNLTDLVEQYEEISIGRARNGNLIELGEDTRISRQHATITYLDIGKFCIRDHSTNGTFINGEKILGEKGLLRDGDKIMFGPYGPMEFRFLFNNLK